MRASSSYISSTIAFPGFDSGPAEVSIESSKSSFASTLAANGNAASGTATNIADNSHSVDNGTGGGVRKRGDAELPPAKRSRFDEMTDKVLEGAVEKPSIYLESSIDATSVSDAAPADQQSHRRRDGERDYDKTRVVSGRDKSKEREREREHEREKARDRDRDSQKIRRDYGNPRPKGPFSS
jgi:hypothetical protein